MLLSARFLAATWFATNLSATLIVTAPYKTGVVICADKRGYDSVRGDQDDSVRLFQLAKSSAYVTTGVSKFLGFPSFQELWNAATMISAYYHGTDFTHESLQGVFNSVDSSFREYLTRIPLSWRPADAYTSPDCLFQIIFMFVNADHRVGIEGFQYCYQSNGLSIDTNGPSGSFPAREANAFGNTAVWMEINHGNDKRFDKFRADPLLKRFIIDKDNPSSIGKNTALEFGRKIISVTSENTHLIENTTYHVSPDCNCAYLDQELGFEWIK